MYHMVNLEKASFRASAKSIPKAGIAISRALAARRAISPSERVIRLTARFRPPFRAGTGVLGLEKRRSE
jgi:hypothetical protein